MSIFKSEVIQVVRQIPSGETMSYGDVAALVGKPRAAQAVGRIAASGKAKTPWHRVVRANGSLAPGFAWGGSDEQQAMLEAEGVEFDSQNRVVKGSDSE